MIDLIKEQKESFKNQIIDELNDSIDSAKQQLENSIESCEKNYFLGTLDTLINIKEHIKEM